MIPTSHSGRWGRLIGSPRFGGTSLLAAQPEAYVGVQDWLASGYSISSLGGASQNGNGGRRRSVSMALQMNAHPKKIAIGLLFYHRHRLPSGQLPSATVSITFHRHRLSSAPPKKSQSSAIGIVCEMPPSLSIGIVWHQHSASACI